MKRMVLLFALLLPLVAIALEINDATRAQLEQLNGVGVTTADKILRERDSAKFTGWDDLRQRVKGLNRKRVQQWQHDGVTVNGERGVFTAVAPKPAKESR